MSSTSGLAIHHAYHLQQFEISTRANVARFKRVFEFGGGFGHMCRLIHELGFRGEYIIFDLPEFSALQRFYLGEHNVPLANANNRRKAVQCVSELETACDLMRSARSDIFIATWSLSEAPQAVREQVMREFVTVAYLLIAFQGNFGEVDNDRFFRDWAKSQTKFDCQFVPIANMPGKQHYLFAGGNSGRRDE
jgi:hypothetical protein